MRNNAPRCIASTRSAEHTQPIHISNDDGADDEGVTKRKYSKGTTAATNNL